MSRTPRLLAVLQLFETNRPVWTVEDIGQTLGMPTSTTYRYVRSLVQAALLDPVVGAGYALGPGFIRYDRILRQSDQVIRVADPIMRDLLDQTSQSAAVILCRRFKDCDMCVHEVEGAKPHPTKSYERGIAMPMFAGATSKVILANLTNRTLKAVYLANEKIIRRTLGVSDWKGFQTQFRDIRQNGYAMTDSEIALGRIGIAAPISREGQVIGGISLVAIPSGTTSTRISGYIPRVISAAASITAALAVEKPVVPR